MAKQEYLTIKVADALKKYYDRKTPRPIYLYEVTYPIIACGQAYIGTQFRIEHRRDETIQVHAMNIQHLWRKIGKEIVDDLRWTLGTLEHGLIDTNTFENLEVKIRKIRQVPMAGKADAHEQKQG